MIWVMGAIVALGVGLWLLSYWKEALLAIMVLAVIGLANAFPWIGIPLIIFLLYKVLTVKDTRSPEQKKQEQRDEEVRQELQRRRDHEHAYGPVNDALFCNHCKKRGWVRSTGDVAVSIGRQSTGLFSKKTWETKKNVTKHHCDNCGTTWHVH